MPAPPLFTTLFGRSPVGLLQEHMRLARDTAQHLPAFFAAVHADDWDKAEQIRADIVAGENKADKVKKQVRLGLPRSLFLPVPRSDLLDLVHMQDRIANRSKDIAGLTLGRRMALPKTVQPSFEEFVASAVAVSGYAVDALDELDELITSGFSGKEVALIENLLAWLAEAEHKSDELQKLVEKSLFAIEKELHPVDVMFLYQIIGWVGDLADDAQAVGNRLLYVIAR